MRKISQTKKKEFLEVDSFFKIFSQEHSSKIHSNLDWEDIEKDEKELDFFLNDYFYYCMEYYMGLIPGYYIK